MLKSLRLGAVLTTVLTTQISTVFLTISASASDMATLNAHLKEAVCSQDWGEAVKTVDQMIAATPSNNQTQRNQLETYRGRMQSLYNSRANVPNPPEGCPGATVSTPTVAANTKTSMVFDQSPEDIESYFGTPLRRHSNAYSYSPVKLWSIFPEAVAFSVNFTSGKAKSITVRFDKDAPYNRTKASKFFKYIFGYQPPNWTLLSKTTLASHQGNHYNVFYNDYSMCMDVGVATRFLAEERQYLLGDTQTTWTSDTNAFGLLSEPRCK